MLAGNRLEQPDGQVCAATQGISYQMRAATTSRCVQPRLPDTCSHDC